MPAGRRSVGVMFAPERPLGDLLGVARRAELVGLDELWLAEDCFLHGGLTAATAVLAQTARLRVGVGLLPTMVRNAAVVAMEIATAASLFPDRLQVGFGHGVESWMRQIDARPPDRMAALRAVVVSVRDLLRGGLVDREGPAVTLHGVRLDHPPSSPPS